MNYYIPYNPNPARNRVGDCTVRAITKATGQDWKTVYAALSAYGYNLCDMPSANHVWGAYLRSQGFKRYIVDDHGQDMYTVEDFCRDNPKGTYILAIDGHVVDFETAYNKQKPHMKGAVNAVMCGFLMYKYTAEDF